MGQSTYGVIPVDFAQLRSAYPTYKKLPKHISDKIASLNTGNTGPRNTPCCYQVCEALNACGAEHRIPPIGHRRPNARMAGQYYLSAVDELEVYLTNRYGKGLSLQGDGAPQRTKAEMWALIDGIQGLITFRDRSYGYHTELWDKTTIIQNGGPGSDGANLTAGQIWAQPRILFWRCGGDDGRDALPAWLAGWWSVRRLPSGAPQYYYFSDQRVAFYAPQRPPTAQSPASRLAATQGKVDLSADGKTVTVTWGDGPMGVLTEVFTASEGGSTVMNGLAQGSLRLEATRLVFAALPKRR